MHRISRGIVAALFAGIVLQGGVLLAQSDTDGSYTAPNGGPPPVAPPLNPNSPLYHLAHDPKQATPTPGYREGNTGGSPYGVAHRGIDTDGGQGWGWIRPSDGDWGDGKWIALQETPGLVIAPHRKLVTATGDADWEFKVWGHMASYKAYDPHLDETLPVFVLQGYEVIGLAAPLRNKIGPPGRIHQRPSGASSRQGSPILSDHGVD